MENDGSTKHFCSGPLIFVSGIWDLLKGIDKYINLYHCNLDGMNEWNEEEVEWIMVGCLKIEN